METAYSKKIRIGQIGIGHNHAAAYFPAVRKYPNLFEIVGYAIEDDKWLPIWGNHPAYKGLKRLTVEEVIEKSDAVLIESDVPNLIKYALMCVKAGKHVHIDKPASGNLEEFRELLKIAEKNKLVVQFGYMYRYNNAILECLDYIKKGKIGEIYSIDAQMSTNHSLEYKKFLSQFDGAGMYILGSHLIDLILLILGKPLKIHRFFKNTKKDGIDLPDNNLVVLEYEKALARVFVSSVEINGWGRRQFFVSGEKGSLEIKPIENTVSMTFSDLDIAKNPYKDLKIDLNIKDIPSDCRYDLMMSDFYEYIVGTKENPFSYEHEYNLKVLLDTICQEKEWRS